MNELAKERLIEFRHHATHVGMIGQSSNTVKNLRNQLVPDLGHALLRIPDAHFLQVSECRLGKADHDRGHALFQTEPLPGLVEVNLAPRVQIG